MLSLRIVQFIPKLGCEYHIWLMYRSKRTSLMSMFILHSRVDRLVGYHILAANGFILVCQVALLAGLISHDDRQEMTLLPCGWAVCANSKF
jgi:hypothetical protein